MYFHPVYKYLFINSSVNVFHSNTQPFYYKITCHAEEHNDKNNQNSCYLHCLWYIKHILGHAIKCNLYYNYYQDNGYALHMFLITLILPKTCIVNCEGFSSSEIASRLLENCTYIIKTIFSAYGRIWKMDQVKIMTMEIA